MPPRAVSWRAKTLSFVHSISNPSSQPPPSRMRMKMATLLARVASSSSIAAHTFTCPTAPKDALSSTPPPIRALPPAVASRLRGAVVLPSLAGAVSELLQNALDAGATQLALAVNPSRPSFALADNGHGIHPDHLGAVGTPCATSKYPPDGRYFGSRGEALAALAQHSTLTVTSRGRGCAGAGSRQCRWSYGERVFEGPAPEHAVLPEPGTTVRVDGLWGDMPVRLKARQGLDVERQWDELTRTVVALLVSGRAHGVGIVVHDESGARRLTVRGRPASPPPPPRPRQQQEQQQQRDGPWDLAVLRQALGVDVVGLLADWVDVRAQLNNIQIEGWMSSKGSGSTGVQFLCVNGFPLMSRETELHREVNRIFAASGFGVVDEADDRGLARKGGGARKGVDRKGMFVLRIECQTPDGMGLLGGEGGTEGKAGVEGEVRLSVRLRLGRAAFRPAAGRS